MTAAFPSWISQVVLQDAYGEAPETNQAAFKPEVGPPKLRRRSSISQDILSCKMWLNSSDWEDLEGFYRSTLLDGSQQFIWKHPRTGVAGVFQFEGDAPKVTGTFGTTFEVQFAIRLISGGVVLPTVLSISPTVGVPGAPVTITGTGFNGATGVTIGGAACTDVTVVNATTITANSPLVAPAGAVDVAVTTPRGTGTGSGLYLFFSHFADFTTEGGADDYLYNGATYAGFAAWLTAIGGTFSRSSSAYYTNSSGLLASASSGVLRFDHDPITLAPKGILREGASTNHFEYSQTFTNAYWGQYNGAVAGSAGTAPDGTTTASSFTASGSTTPEIYVSGITATANTVYTKSVYAKAGTNPYFALSVGDGTNYVAAVFNLAAGTVTQTSSSGNGTLVSSAASNTGNGWYRCSITFSFATTVGKEVQFVIAAAPTGNTFTGYGEVEVGPTSGTTYLWGAQQEPLAFASSYIPTTSSSATRAPDVLDFPWTATTGTAVVKTQGILGGNGSPKFIGVNGADTPLFYQNPTEFGSYNGAAVYHTLPASGAFAGLHAIGSAGNLSGLILGADGDTPTSDATAWGVGSTPSTMYLGGDGGSNETFGWYLRLGLYAGTELTSAQLQSLLAGL